MRIRREGYGKPVFNDLSKIVLEGHFEELKR